MEPERQLVIKAAPANLAALETRLHQLHPYELPEFIVLGADASVAYTAWVRSAGPGAGESPV
jgi:periplasmic divalent cation tolerance protein